MFVKEVYHVFSFKVSKVQTSDVYPLAKHMFLWAE